MGAESTTIGANVARFLPAAAARVPDHLAVRVPLKRSGSASEAIPYLDRTFAELERETNAAVRLLHDAGLRRGMRTLLMVKPGHELILMTFALFKLGAVPVVIDPGMGLKSFLSCVERTKPEALVGISLAQVISKVFRVKFRSVQHRVTPGKAAFRRDLEAALAADEQDGSMATAVTEPDELAAILFTSGSTGPPKGVCYAHGMFDAQVRLIQAQYDIQPGEIDLPMLPIFALFNPAMGMTTVVPEMNPSKPATVDPAKIVQAIQQNKVTNSFGSPVLWSKIAAYCTEQGIVLHGVKRILMAGAPAPPSLIETMRKLLPDGEVHTPYGATESLPVATISGTEILGETWARTEQGEGTCVGKVFPEMQLKVIRICDDAIPQLQASDEVASGEVGELIVSGPVVTASYDALPEATVGAKMHDVNGTLWHRMGDLGRVDFEGRIWFYGRKAERVRATDGDHYTDRIEPIFNKHPHVFRTALIGLGEAGSQELGLAVEPYPEHFPKSAAARESLIAELKELGRAHDHTSSVERFFFVKKFPVDVRHNAKIHRLTLAKELRW